MVQTHNLGFPRIGIDRELKFAQERFWNGQIDERALLEVGKNVRVRHWAQQRAAGIDHIPVGDFAWYDQILTHCALFGALPSRFGFDPKTLTLAQYFELARGNAYQPAMELTKWFDTNYHYLVPEWRADTRFDLQSRWLLEEIDEALLEGNPVKPVIIGPLTLLWLGKTKEGFDKLDLLPRLLPEYQVLLKEIAARGIEWVQIDEPILALDLPQNWLSALWSSYRKLALGPVRILLATYFGSVAKHVQQLASLPIAGLHLDLVRAPEQLPLFAQSWPSEKVLSLGIVDGRNVWRTELEPILRSLRPVEHRLGNRLWLAPSCSLLHCPIDLAAEHALDNEIRNGLAFARQKLDEITLLRKALTSESIEILEQIRQSDAHVRARKTSARIHDAAVKERQNAISAQDFRRSQGYAERIAIQRAKLNLPLIPTTTIGSFPQTPEIRAARAAFKRGSIREETYHALLRQEIKQAIAEQEALGLDVLVHGEAERNDMVEYFGELLEGFVFTANGWVQSYGSRCVKPPIIYGDVSRASPMTVDWSRYAQSITTKPVKAMLTGPITLLQWSFVRDDQPRRQTAYQLALAVRDEVRDLENAGLNVIQIDEPAFREGLPLAQAEWPGYLTWAVDAFRLAVGGAKDSTQIHTHMCYSEFNDILPSIAAMDADVITIETSRSDMKLLDGFSRFAYPNDIGPGVYDIHSPRLTRRQDMLELLRKAAAVVDYRKLWVNPDCGLKTRTWPETRAALREMVAAADLFRKETAEIKGERIDSCTGRVPCPEDVSV